MIRQGIASDAAALAALAGELGYPSTPRAMAERLAPLLGDPDQQVLVYERGGAVVAWIHVAAVRSLESGPFVEIRGLVVTETERGHGIGRALVGAVEAWARTHGFARVRVRSRQEREGAHRFYGGLGYTCVKTQLAFDRRLDAE